MLTEMPNEPIDVEPKVETPTEEPAATSPLDLATFTPDVMIEELESFRKELVKRIIRNGILVKYTMGVASKMDRNQMASLGRTQDELRGDTSFLLYLDEKLAALRAGGTSL